MLKYNSYNLIKEIKISYVLTYKLFEADDFRPPEYRDFKKKPDLRHQLLKMDRKTFDELYASHKWYLVNSTKPDIKNNLFTLVNLAYDDLGGHIRINTPDKVTQDSDINFWTAINTNDDEYADAVIFGKNTKYGIKISGFGHMGNLTSMEVMMNHLIKLLNTNGYFIEASERTAKILLKREVPVIHDIEIIKEMFGGKDVIFTDPEQTWYIRTSNSGNKYKEVLFGKPMNV